MHPILNHKLADLRSGDLRAEVHRDRLGAKGRQPAPLPQPPAVLARSALAYARYALASLASSAFGFNAN